MISSGLLYWAWPQAMPMLAEVKTSRPPMENGALERLLDAERDRVGLVRVADVVQQDRELVAAEPGERVALPQAGLEPARHGDEQFVAHQVAEVVVDDLEAVEVEIERREWAAGAPLLELFEPAAEPLDEHGAVAQPGQRIEEPGAVRPLRRRPRAPWYRSAIPRCGADAGRRRAPRDRGTGTAGRCRPRGGSGARAGSGRPCRRDARRAPPSARRGRRHGRARTTR